MKENKLIAEFMEVEKENDLYLFTTPMDDYKTDTLHFEVSWDWLMPVMEKINSLEVVTNVNYNIGGDFIIEGLTKSKVLNIIMNSEDFHSDHDMVYEGVVEFIKDYNQKT